jgi:membrane-associated protease RseP (regulator of RpoE activity)
VDPAGQFRNEPLHRFPPQGFAWRPHPKFQDRIWLHVLLFILTIVTTTVAGIGHYLAFRADFAPPVGVALTSARVILPGLFYSVTILAILGCHELGHYFACRYYDVDASLPFFLPVPTPLTGTLGAFIRIREPIPTKPMLFDIGIAGPLAGFAVAVPALLLGVSMSHVVKLPADFSGFELGEPLLFKLVSWLTWGSVPDGYSLNLHPIAFAAWFGLLATALNLFPVAQLDGGHICYAVFGRRSTYVTMVTVIVAIALSFVSASWIVWTVLIVVMLLVIGPRHPRTYDEDVPLDRARRWMALAALIIFVLCFTPAPISPFDLIGR